MFANQPTVLTAGGFIFAPPGTAHYPFGHHLESRDWTSDERKPWPALGEWSGKRSYSNGRFDGIFPSQVIVGDSECIAQGEQRYPPVPLVPLINGFPGECYRRPPDPPFPPPSPQEIDIRDRPTQLFFAQVSEALYDDPVLAAVALQDYLGDDYTITAVANDDSIFPGSLIATGPRGTVVIISGTTTPQQLATQAFLGLVGMQRYGPYRTLPLWFDGQEVIAERIVDAGADPALPIVLVGHSYGGAIAAILATRYKMAHPEQDIKLLTFAMPKPGDRGMIDILNTIASVHIVNAGDPVPSLPPTTPEIGILGFAIPFGFAERWALPTIPLGRKLLFPDGELLDTQQSSLSLAFLWDAALKALDGDPLALIGNHRIAAYRARLAYE